MVDQIWLDITKTPLCLKCWDCCCFLLWFSCTVCLEFSKNWFFLILNNIIIVILLLSWCDIVIFYTESYLLIIHRLNLLFILKGHCQSKLIMLFQGRKIFFYAILVASCLSRYGISRLSLFSFTDMIWYQKLSVLIVKIILAIPILLTNLYVYIWELMFCGFHLFLLIYFFFR